MQSSECDERIESFASPPYCITLFNFKCECILHGSTGYYLDITKLYITRSSVWRTIFFTPSNRKIDETEPRYNETSLQRTNLASPLALRYVEVPLYWLRTQFLCVLLETGPTVLRHWSDAGPRQYLHCYVVLSISTVTVIKPATSRSTVKCSTDFPWSIKKTLITAKQPRHAKYHWNIGLKYTVQYSTLAET